MPVPRERSYRKEEGDRATGERVHDHCASRAGPGPAIEGRSRRGRKILRAAASAAVIAATFGFAIPRIASYRSVWASIHTMTWPHILLVATAAAASMISYWVTIRAVLPRLTLRQAAAVNLGSNAVANTLPAGGALAMGVSWAMLSSWGLSTADYVLYTLVTGIWNVFTLLGMPVLALLVMTTATRPNAVLITAAATGLAVLAAMVTGLGLLLHSQAFALRAGRALQRLLAVASSLARRPPPANAAGSLSSFRDRAGALLAARGWRITAATVASYLTLWLVLLACLRGTGLSQAQMPWQTSLAAFAFIRLLTALPITPGGLGVTELGLAGILATSAGSAASVQVTAAVLLYRAVTYLPSIPLGALACLTWRLAPALTRTSLRRASPVSPQRHDSTSQPHRMSPPDLIASHHAPQPGSAGGGSQLAALVAAVPVPLLPDTHHTPRSNRA
jgi:putative heme transporter